MKFSTYIFKNTYSKGHRTGDILAPVSPILQIVEREREREREKERERERDVYLFKKL
ncbi:MAG: hypothetical protein KTM48_03995 [Wolbachia endosymbiont of Pissodes strobi]|nr:hypothetical protein [Wolbachia endosymbiont of Pissodes strobi]